MRRSILAPAAALFLIAGLACDPGLEGPTAPLTPDGPSLALYDTVLAQWAGTDYKITEAVIGPDCAPHTSCPPKSGYTVDVLIDAGNSDFYDAAVFTCGAITDTIWSSDSCWYCRAGCANACTGGEDACVLQQGARDGDCRGYNCPSGYTMVEGYGLTEVPKCIKPVEDPGTPSVTLSGPTYIQPGSSCTWTANGSGGTSPYTYTWYYDGMWRKAGSDNTYTGGVLSGDLNTEFVLKVIIKDANNETDSAEILVRESSAAKPCMQ